LYFDFAIVDVDRLDQTKRNNVAREAGLFNRLQRVTNLCFRNGHHRKLASLGSE
jgi:hypothetical protein